MPFNADRLQRTRNQTHSPASTGIATTPGAGFPPISPRSGPHFNSLRAVYRVTIANAPRSEPTFALTLPFNPESVAFKFGGEYVEHGPLGFSHGISQYIRTKSAEIAFTVFSDTLVSAQRPDAPDDEVIRSTLYALTLPTRPGQGPPQVIVSWPRLATITGRVKDVDFDFKRFTAQGSVRYWTADITLVQDLDAFRSSIYGQFIGPTNTNSPSGD